MKYITALLALASVTFSGCMAMEVTQGKDGKQQISFGRSKAYTHYTWVYKAKNLPAESKKVLTDYANATSFGFIPIFEKSTVVYSRDGTSVHGELKNANGGYGYDYHSKLTIKGDTLELTISDSRIYASGNDGSTRDTAERKLKALLVDPVQVSYTFVEADTEVKPNP